MSKNKILIIGKNSKIVNEIKPQLLNCDSISHNEIASTNLNIYEKIFIFSWSHKSKQENLIILNKLDLAKVVFISSIAVLACARRHQWALYPNSKIECENIVLKGGGQIIRIGVWDQSLLRKISGLVPITTPNTLIKAIELCQIEKKKIYYPIIMQKGELEGVKLVINKIINKISILLPATKTVQIPLVVISKIVGIKDYGYTNDCLYFFCDRVLVGFGAIGSRVSSELKRRRLQHSIIASNEENQLLINNGFNGTRIGRLREGLSNLWHGVWISCDKTGELRKNVPLFVSRPRLPKEAIIGTVIEVDINSSNHSIVISHPLISDVRLHFNNIHLAAGVVNNIKIIQKTHNISAKLSDQEVCIIGEVETEELVSKKIIGRKLGIVFGRKVIKYKNNNNDFLLDFRPQALSFIYLDSQNIYNNRVEQIILKLLKSFSLTLINQALFNKFGMSFDVGKFSIVVQIDAPNSISLNKDGDLSRTRLSKYVIDDISDKITSDFISFIRNNNFNTSDAIHLHGGFALENHPDLMHLVKSKKIFFHGNVFNNEKLGAFHNTVEMINREMLIIKNV
jgi:hypothetical protein